MRRWSGKIQASAGDGGPDSGPADRLNLTISRVLAGGLSLAVALLVVGAILSLVGRPTSSSGVSITDMPRALGALEPVGFFDLGLLVLLATPVARVVTLALGFARRKSWLFCGLSVFVLAVLGLSVYLGLRG